MSKDLIISALTANWGYSPRDNKARCPAHKGGDRNLHVTVEGNRVLTYCFSRKCKHKAVVEALGIKYEKQKQTKKRIEYVYKTTKDRSFKHVRIQTGDDKKMRWYPVGCTELKQDEKILPYSVGEGEKILFVEGEKAAHAGEFQLGKEYTILTWGGLSLKKFDWSILEDKEIYLWPDNDTSGYEQMDRIAQYISRYKNKGINIIQIHDAFEKDDVADFVQRREGLNRLIKNNSHPYMGSPIKPIIEQNDKGFSRALMFSDLEMIFNDRRAFAQIAGRKTQINPLNLKPDDFIDFENLPQSKLRQSIQSNFNFIRYTKSETKYTPARFTEMDWRLSHESYLYDRRIDPFLHFYLDKIQPKENYDLLNNWAEDLYNISERSLPFSQWFSRYFFIGVYERAVLPGSSIPTIPVITGDEDAGKSALGRNILPPVFQDAGATEVILGSDPKEFFESIQGKIIAEAAEISGYSKQDQNTIKANLTRLVDTPRLAYGRIPVTVPRRVIFYATSNEPTPLMNTGTGNRRFCVMQIEGRARYPLEEFFAERRDELFAAAKYAFNEGMRAKLPPELVQIQKDTNETYQASDLHIEESLEQHKFSKSPQQKPNAPGWLVIDIAEAIWGHNLESVRFARDSHFRMTKALRKFGWTRDVNAIKDPSTGKRSRFWHPPLDNEIEPTEAPGEYQRPQF